jgi:hypothetical protein
MDHFSTASEFTNNNSHLSHLDFNYSNDNYQECAAYMKTKQFLGNRILEQQLEIEKLKNLLHHQTLKNTQYLDWISHLENVIRKISNYFYILLFFRY